MFRVAGMKVLMVSLFAIYSSLFSPQVLYRIIRCDPFLVVKLGQTLFGFTFSSQIHPFSIFGKRNLLSALVCGDFIYLIISVNLDHQGICDWFVMT